MRHRKKLMILSVLATVKFSNVEGKCCTDIQNAKLKGPCSNIEHISDKSDRIDSV